ncbi:PDZ domain-containing protein [Longimicrobium sp.]|uniref:PDZ domain-containing protein n=1 Tax=Longimicrobium sp. TaxID=2029185 RepID=UPI003B3B35A5
MRSATRKFGRRLAAALALGLVAQTARAQQCGEGLPRTATLGIGLLQCVGGLCTLNARDGAGRTHDFSTEPKVWRLEADGPAAGVLRDGDQILAIDGALITTRDGGRRLANLRAGVPVSLRIRRGGSEMRVSVTPRPGCNTPALAVTPTGGRPDAPPASAEGRPGDEGGPRIYFGMELDCGDCGWRREGDSWRWHSSQPMLIKAAVPGSPAHRAGLRAGDVVLRINGHLLTDRGAGQFFDRLSPGSAVRFEVRRGGRTLTIPIVPEIRRGP